MAGYRRQYRESALSRRERETREWSPSPPPELVHAEKRLELAADRLQKDTHRLVGRPSFAVSLLSVFLCGAIFLYFGYQKHPFWVEAQEIFGGLASVGAFLLILWVFPASLSVARELLEAASARRLAEVKREHSEALRVRDWHKAEWSRHVERVRQNRLEELQRERIKRRESVEGWFKMNWLEFDEACADLMNRCGYSAVTTRSGSDEGVDIEATHGKTLYAVQCKAWKKGKVGRPEVQKLAGVVAIGKCDRGIIISLRGLSRPAKRAAREAGIRAWTVYDLVRMAGSAAAR